MKRYYILPIFSEEKTYYMLLEVGNTDRDYKAMEELVAANWSYIWGEAEQIQAQRRREPCNRYMALVFSFVPDAS